MGDTERVMLIGMFSRGRLQGEGGRKTGYCSRSCGENHDPSAFTESVFWFVSTSHVGSHACEMSIHRASRLNLRGAVMLTEELKRKLVAMSELFWHHISFLEL